MSMSHHGQRVDRGLGQNTARQAMLYAGIPKEVNAFTLIKVCASGMKSDCLAGSRSRPVTPNV